MAHDRSRSDRLRAYADELYTLADACDTPSRSLNRAETLIAEGERIGRGVVGVFRGPSRG